MEVCDRFHLKRQTYHLAVYYTDKYLSSIAKGEQKVDSLQLLGISSLITACKIEEIYFPKFYEFADVTDGKCTVAEIFEMES